jgi:hypothetical protein
VRYLVLDRKLDGVELSAPSTLGTCKITITLPIVKRHVETTAGAERTFDACLDDLVERKVLHPIGLRHPEPEIDVTVIHEDEHP